METNCQSLIYGSFCGKRWAAASNCETFYFDAITSVDYHRRRQLNFAKQKVSRNGKRPFTFTEKAVWESHYRVWQRIKEHPAQCGIVAEHDADPIIAKLEKLSIDFLKKEAYNKELLRDGYIPLSFNNVKSHKHRMHPANAYFITSEWVDKAIDHIDQSYNNSIDCNTDGFIFDVSAKSLRKYHKRKLDIENIWVVNPVDIMYSITTIEHPKRNNDEEIDIPGLRW